ncbi:MAG: prolipoprotein diacylglyceryl transferase [Myxococcales bacterium]|nr:prolipoprotein diacylglyceryl transferase [Myxococcales bacterium]
MHPILFNLGETPVAAYGVLLAVSLILGWILSLRLAKLDKLPADLLGTGYVLSVGGGLLVARSMWLFANGELGDLSALISLEAGGLSGFGGVLAGLIIAGLFCQNKKIPPWAWLDAAAPAFLIGMVIERVAAFLAGADFGHYVDASFPLAVQYPAESVVHAFHRTQLSGLVLPADRSLPVHPSQLYAALSALVGVILAFVVRGRRRYSGEVALFALGYFAVVRYLIEDPFRHDATPDLAGPITLGQVTAIAVVVLVVVTHVGRLRALEEDPKGLQQWLGGPWTPGWDEDGKKKKKKKASKKAAGDKADDKKANDKKADKKKADAD